MPKQDEPNWTKLAGIGLEVAVGAGLGAIVGAWIDRKFDCRPWATLIGTILGFAGGLYLMIKELIRATRR